MQGADEFYKLVYYVGNIKNNICNLKAIPKIAGHSDYAYQYENIVFLLMEHARGKTFKIWIYETSDIQHYIKDEHLEVYGITGGDPGWTESYGWVKKGAWIDYIEKYFNSLREYKCDCEYKNRVEEQDAAAREQELENRKIEKFNVLFSEV